MVVLIRNVHVAGGVKGRFHGTIQIGTSSQHVGKIAVGAEGVRSRAGHRGNGVRRQIDLADAVVAVIRNVEVAKVVQGYFTRAF